MDPKADHQTGEGLNGIYLIIDEVQFRGSSLKQHEEGSMRRGVTRGQETPQKSEKRSGRVVVVQRLASVETPTMGRNEEKHG